MKHIKNKTSPIVAKLDDSENGDLKVVNVARVSFAKHVDEFTEGDERLIRFLATHKHWTPFSHCRETYAIKVQSDNMKFLIFEFLSVGLSQAEKTGMVVKYIPGKGVDDGADKGVIYIRHSLYGWANILNKFALDNITLSLALGMYIIGFDLHKKYPVSYKYLIDQRVQDYIDLTTARTDEIEYIEQMRTQHTTADAVADDPEFIDYTMYETVPIAIARQRFKHMVGCTYNEVSRRYVDSEPVFYRPETWRARPDKSIKQGSGAEVPREVIFNDVFNEDSINGWHNEVYKYLTSEAINIAPEMARFTLPQAMMTEYYVTGNMAAWQRFFDQRIEATAQVEIQRLATLCKQEIEK